MQAAEMFYFMFESRKDPKTSPIVLWMTGTIHGAVLRIYVSHMPELIVPCHHVFSTHTAARDPQTTSVACSCLKETVARLPVTTSRRSPAANMRTQVWLQVDLDAAPS